MSRQPENRPPEYLIIGHVTRDELDGGSRLGGTAAYSAITAHRMGARVALFTAGLQSQMRDSLTGVEIVEQPGSGTTTFINEYRSTGRVQTLSERAADLNPELIPAEWSRAKLVHLAPVAGEVPLDAAKLFPGSAIAYSLQGWMREWDGAGRVSPAPLPDYAPPVGQRTAAFLSIEDLGFDRTGLREITSRFPLVLLTLGSQGAEIHQGGAVQRAAPVPAQEADPTGAGDVFAGAFLVSWLLQGRSLQESARVANALAAASVSGEGIQGIPTAGEIQSLAEVYG